MRTQEEILERFKTADDMFDTQRGDIIAYMEFENVKPFLKEEYVRKVESGEETWTVASVTDAKEKILDYLDFAYDKAKNQRGLSAARSMEHFKTWIWLEDETFYNEIFPLLENYTDYGIPALDKIAEHYGYIKS